jgi:hypothetical protein
VLIELAQSSRRKNRGSGTEGEHFPPLAIPQDVGAHAAARVSRYRQLHGRDPRHQRDVRVR